VWGHHPRRNDDPHGSKHRHPVEATEDTIGGIVHALKGDRSYPTNVQGQLVSGGALSMPRAFGGYRRPHPPLSRLASEWDPNSFAAIK
jgi:hypothetical protein